MAVAVLSVAPAPLSALGPLKQLWRARTGGLIAATPTVAGGNVYVGSWDGYEYAYRAKSGRRLWRMYLGRTYDGHCGYGLATLGITSAARLDDHTLYLGGGDLNWYALRASSGKILWRVGTAPNPLSGGYYNWSTPAVFRGYAYVGLSSQCDNPLTQGELLQVDLASHRILRAWKVVRDGQVGGGIWTTPVVDSSTNTVFVTTGTRISAQEPYAESVVALDATKLRVKGHWPLPLSDPTHDADWGTSPVLFRDRRSRSLVAAVSKNGILYAFRRDALARGPVWQTRLARGGDCPQCGDGTTSTGLFDGRRLVFAAGVTTIGGRAYAGSVRAIDPTTGRLQWQVGLPSEVLGALAEAHGLVAVPAAYGGLYVLGAAGGAVLYANTLNGAGPPYQPIYAAPRIADGRLFIGTTDGVVHAFKFPAHP
jgi:outer membrane protein assembly factor BamB